MGDWSTPLHLSISPTPDLDLIPAWVIDKTIRYLVHKNINTTQPERKTECYELDPYCFSPKINGIHGHLAYGKLGLAQLKRALTVSRDQNEIGDTLNTLCDLIRSPEMAMNALKLNILAQLGRLISHNHWYVRERTVQALKILALQGSGRERIADDVTLMDSIICCMRDESSCVRRATYDLVHRLSTNYFVVAKLMELGFIKIIVEELKQKVHTDDEVGGEGWEDEDNTEARYEDCVTKFKEPGDTTLTSFEKVNEESVNEAAEELDGEEEEEEEDCKALNEEECEILDEPDLMDKDISTIVTLLETLTNLMAFSADATLDAICYDVLHLKKFLYHEDRTVRLLTWNIFKQVFSTDIGQMSLIPHNLLDDMMKPFDHETDEGELIEVMGTLMLALVKVENRVAALKKGVLDRIVSTAKQPQLSSNKRLAVLNVLSHLVEIPEVRTLLIKHLPDTVLAVNLDSPTIEHHVHTHMERALWKP